MLRWETLGPAESPSRCCFLPVLSGGQPSYIQTTSSVSPSVSHDFAVLPWFHPADLLLGESGTRGTLCHSPAHRASDVLFGVCSVHPRCGRVALAAHVEAGVHLAAVSPLGFAFNTPTSGAPSLGSSVQEDRFLPEF